MKNQRVSNRKIFTISTAGIDDAEVVGFVHSTAWKQAYTDVFPEEYLNVDTPDKRKQEFLEACKNKNAAYYLMYEDKKAIGILKVIDITSNDCEISSFYILNDFRNKGYGKQAVAYLKDAFGTGRIQLWVLEENVKARHFYENNGFKNTGKTRNIYRGSSYTQLLYEFLYEFL